MLWQSCTEKVVRRSQHATGSVIKHQEVSECFRRRQEAPGSFRKHMEAQHQNNNKQTNKI